MTFKKKNCATPQLQHSFRKMRLGRLWCRDWHQGKGLEAQPWRMKGDWQNSTCQGTVVTPHTSCPLLLENSFCVSVGLGKLVWNGPSLGCMISSLISALRLGVNFFSLFLLPFVSLLFLTWAIWFSCKSNLFPYLLDRFVLGPGRMFLSACLIFTSWVCPDMFLFTHGWPVCLHSLLHLQIHMGM